MSAAQTLLGRIRMEGAIDGRIVKVDRFLNHLVDPELIEILARDLAEHFVDQGISKVLTAETSGIIPAMAVAAQLRVPFIYAKKKRPITMASCYFATSYSFTKQERTTLYTSREVLTAADRVLFVDDFYAQGSTLAAVEDIISQSGAELVGAAVLINKSERRDIAAILTLDQIISAF